MAKKFDLKSLMNDKSKVDTGARDAVAFKIEFIPLAQLQPSEMNIYSVDNVAELRGSIEMFGLQQNLTVRKSENGENYEIISGHRRFKAMQELFNAGDQRFAAIPCYITKTADDIEAELQLILANSTSRILTDYERTHQAARLRELLEEYEKSGFKVTGRKREIVAEFLKVSPAQVGRMERIANNLTPGLAEEFKKDNINITTAYELSRLESEAQAEALDAHNKGVKLTPETAKAHKTPQQPLQPPPTHSAEPTQVKQQGEESGAQSATQGQQRAKIKECPFCGHSASLNKEYDKLSNSRWVTCDGCLVATRGYSGEDAAITAWNRRVRA